MKEVAAAVAHTPVWVWPVFVVVLFLGARNLWPRERPIGQMFILPAVLLILAAVNLTAGRADLTLVIPAFVASFAIGIGVGWNLVPRDVVALRDRGTVRVPGSVAPLLVVIAVLILRYAFMADGRRCAGIRPWRSNSAPPAPCWPVSSGAGSYGWRISTAAPEARLLLVRRSHRFRGPRGRRRDVVPVVVMAVVDRAIVVIAAVAGSPAVMRAGIIGRGRRSDADAHAMAEIPAEIGLIGGVGRRDGERR